MKYALISPIETIFSYDGTVLGSRIATVSKFNFDVAEPLFWIECNDTITADEFYWDGEAIVARPVPPAPEPVAAPVQVQGGPTIVD